MLINTLDALGLVAPRPSGLALSRAVEAARVASM